MIRGISANLILSFKNKSTTTSFAALIMAGAVPPVLPAVSWRRWTRHSVSGSSAHRIPVGPGASDVARPAADRRGRQSVRASIDGVLVFGLIDARRLRWKPVGSASSCS